jgi:hypothetical protein
MNHQTGKRQYRIKIGSYYTDSDACRMWQGLQTITDYKGKHSCTSLPDKLNYFYARFEVSKTEACMRASAVPDDCVITLSVADVSKTFKQVNIHKAAGPDGLPGCVLRAYADQLANVFTDIFNLSLNESVILTCFKQTTIVTVPKNTRVTCLNDYRPVAIASVAMKCFERLVMAHINTIIPETHSYLTPLSQKPTPILIPRQQIHRGCNLYCTPHYPFPPDPQHGGPSGVRAMFPPVLPVHP